MSLVFRLTISIGIAFTAALASPDVSAAQPPVRVIKPNDANGPVYGCFGQSVVIAGNFVFVGDPCERSPTLSISGAVYRLRRHGEGWIVDQHIKAPNQTSAGEFGFSLAIGGDLAVGAPGDGSGGLVYVYSDIFSDAPVFDGATSSPFLQPGARFGESVASASGASFGGFIAGAPAGTHCTGGDGAGFALRLPILPVYICPPRSVTGGEFGTAIVTRNNLALIAAYGFESVIGSGHLMDLGIPGIIDPVEVSLFVPSDPNIFREFGASIAMDDTTVVFGAPINGALGDGEVWIYSGSIPNWGLNTLLTDPNSNVSSFAFGSSVALSGSSLWVGNPAQDPVFVYEYTKSSGGWMLTDSIGPDAVDAAANFGASLAVDGMTWVAGAPSAQAPDGPLVGAVYISADDYLFEGDFDR